MQRCREHHHYVNMHVHIHTLSFFGHSLSFMASTADGLCFPLTLKSPVTRMDQLLNFLIKMALHTFDE